MNQSVKEMTSKELALVVLRRNTARIEKIEETVREQMDKPKFINMDVDKYEKEWNNRIEKLTLDTNFN